MVSPGLGSHLADLLNCSKAAATFRGEKSVARQISKLAQEYKLNWAFPWAKRQALEFIVILSKEGGPREIYIYNNIIIRQWLGLMTSSIKVYLRRVRALHIEAGLSALWTSGDVRQVLKGAGNSYCPAPGAPIRNRVAITPFLMWKLKEGLRDSNMSLHRKRLLWLFMTWAYMGAFRSGCCSSQGHNIYTLLGRLTYWLNRRGRIAQIARYWAPT